MKTTNQKNQITRRGFLELGSAALATVGFLAEANAANAAKPGKTVDTAKPDSAQDDG